MQGELFLLHGLLPCPLLLSPPGELRSGAWGFAKARLEDVLSVPPEQLWGRLMAQQGRLHWLRH